MHQAFRDLSRPPRHVPFSVRCRNLFGGTTNQGGWIFLGGGLFFCWLFALHADMSFLYFRGELETISGVVLQIEKTGYSRGKGEPIYANYYSFHVGGLEYQGVSYVTRKLLGVGRSVTIEFPKGKPQHSRIIGMRRNVLETSALLVLLFPAVGLGMVAFGLKRGLKANRLLAFGVLGRGRLKLKVPTNYEVDSQTVYKLTFQFIDEYGLPYEVTIRTNQPRPLEDDEQEPVLYNPHNPSYAAMLDNLSPFAYF